MNANCNVHMGGVQIDVEKCKRSCQHQVCKRLCPMKCTKNVCEKPCSKRLRCGHPCIGYCGDPCPLLCRICDSEKLAKLIVGNENNPLARFVLLEGCGHVLEAGDLHKLLSQETGEIGMKLCPVCHEPIYANRRFFDLIMKSYVDVQQLLMKLISNIKDQKEEVWEFMKGMQGLSNFKNEVHQICKLFPYTQNMQELSYIAACEVNLCKFRMQVLHQMDIFLNENKAFIAISMPHIHFIKERVMQLSIRISPQMMEEITCELQRLRVLTYIRRLQQSAEESADAELRKILCSIENLMDPKIRFDRDLEEKVIQQLTLSKKYSSDGLPVSVKERITILPAVGLGQGHWFKCPNSHIYNINDCGRATGIRDCPKCSTAISGRQLAL
ncbi:hypothetical protein SK128_019393 [Halocaridina rubra]|uniref:NFX1-type zinc finger-containing protein 1 n=1 Tax=Halocaridina rubra TaxID=373956 RepID=A0AAN8XCP1_HALRR